MNNSVSKNPHGFDNSPGAGVLDLEPAGAGVGAAYPEVADVYAGFYLRLEDLSAEASSYLLGANAVIGSSLIFDSANLEIVTDMGLRLASLSAAVSDALPAQTTERLASYAARGWIIKVLLSATYYRALDKKGLADVAFICWEPLGDESDAALTAFAKGIAERFAMGERVELMLSQEQFIHVLESDGRWFFTRELKREPLEKGVVVFKSRRSFSERLTVYALAHRVGCNVLAILAWIVLAGSVFALIWFFFLRVT